MPFLIIILVLLAIVGSWLWLKPSERDRRSARLRQYAIGKGLKVRFISPGRRDTKVIYSKAVVNELDVEKGSSLVGKLVREEGILSWNIACTFPDFVEAVESFVEAYEDIVELELSDGQISFTWSERGGEKGGEQVIDDFMSVYEKIMAAL